MCYDMSSIVVFFLLFISLVAVFSLFFFFNDTATTEIYTLSLHDALPIYVAKESGFSSTTVSIVLNNAPLARYIPVATKKRIERDRKSTRLNSSHGYISYAVFCLKKKKHTPQLYVAAGTNNELIILEPPMY